MDNSFYLPKKFLIGGRKYWFGLIFIPGFGGRKKKSESFVLIGNTYGADSCVIGPLLLCINT